MMTDGDYTGGYYFPHLQKVTTATLRRRERECLKRAEKLQDEAVVLEDEAKVFLYEQNYRKHIKTLKPLLERQDTLADIINNPVTSKTARKKAEREYALVYDAIWGMMKYGREAKAGK